MPIAERFRPAYGAPACVREIAPLRPEMSFRSHLLHKLNLVLWAEGTQRAAAKAVGVHVSTLHRWMVGVEYPALTGQAKLDARYQVAVEKRRLWEVQRAA